MGVTIVSLEQRVLDASPVKSDFDGLPDIAVFSEGIKRRHKYFSKAFKSASSMTVIHCPRAADVPSMPCTDALFEEIVAAAQAKDKVPVPIKVLVDVSCLSRQHIAQVFAAAAQIAQTRIAVQLQVAYSLAAFANPPEVWATKNRAIRPVHRAFSGWTSEGASAPLDVVVGLGYEKGKALGAVEYLEPRHRWIWTPLSPETAYLQQLQKHNRSLLESGLERERFTSYEVMSPVDTFFSLRSLVEGIAKGARPVLLPFGPKVFFAVNLLVAMSVPEAAVWHVSGERDDYDERSPSGNSVILTCALIGDGAAAIRTP
jgi:hypothetical protein